MKPLNPIMAVVLATAVGAMPPMAFATGGTVTVPAGVPVDGDSQNSITRLTELLGNKDSAAVTDVGQRLAKFMLEPEDGASFVAAGVNAAALDAAAKAWTKEQPAGPLAVLYFVVGTGSISPSWVTSDSLLSKTLPPKRRVEGKLRKALERFTQDAQIAPGAEADAAGAFLNVALAEAKKALDDDR